MSSLTCASLLQWFITLVTTSWNMCQNNGTNIRTNDRKHAKVYPREARNGILDNKIDYLENKMKMVEGELREPAAIEAGLYSVVADHMALTTGLMVQIRPYLIICAIIFSWKNLWLAKCTMKRNNIFLRQKKTILPAKNQFLFGITTQYMRR